VRSSAAGSGSAVFDGATCDDVVETLPASAARFTCSMCVLSCAGSAESSAAMPRRPGTDSSETVSLLAA
jgi:hypothetical protein